MIVYNRARKQKKKTSNTASLNLAITLQICQEKKKANENNKHQIDSQTPPALLE